MVAFFLLRPCQWLEALLKVCGHFEIFATLESFRLKSSREFAFLQNLDGRYIAYRWSKLAIQEMPGQKNSRILKWEFWNFWSLNVVHPRRPYGEAPWSSSIRILEHRRLFSVWGHTWLVGRWARLSLVGQLHGKLAIQTLNFRGSDSRASVRLWA